MALSGISIEQTSCALPSNLRISVSDLTILLNFDRQLFHQTRIDSPANRNNNNF